MRSSAPTVYGTARVVRLSVPAVSAGSLLTEPNDAPTARSAPRLLAHAVLIDDAGLLFTPELALDPLALLRELSRRHPP
jgi:hypothetical protein